MLCFFRGRGVIESLARAMVLGHELDDFLVGRFVLLAALRDVFQGLPPQRAEPGNAMSAFAGVLLFR